MSQTQCILPNSKTKLQMRFMCYNNNTLSSFDIVHSCPFTILLNIAVSNLPLSMPGHHDVYHCGDYRLEEITDDITAVMVYL